MSSTQFSSDNSETSRDRAVALHRVGWGQDLSHTVDPGHVFYKLDSLFSHCRRSGKMAGRAQRITVYTLKG